ncbi:MAG: hypothetical protein [Wendovervirus sonii]|uniref:Uncharacterized protein n=1 Tax=phage Lak_Megaphage_Sonny TaxID=3109229 RepID=A0ABZ0Z624_9CAUD|nr:MAG: hypothetical protein [phage Lak_Megaphage_Sonny]
MLLMIFQLCFIQRITATPYVSMQDLSQTLELFQNSSSIEEFETSINKEDSPLLKFDFNNDGYADYLRCIELNVHNDTSYILIQACIGVNTYHDIASICITKTNIKAEIAVAHITGDELIYGSNFRQCHLHCIYLKNHKHFSDYSIWQSPYCWGHYPNGYMPISKRFYCKPITHPKFKGKYVKVRNR